MALREPQSFPHTSTFLRGFETVCSILNVESFLCASETNSEFSRHSWCSHCHSNHVDGSVLARFLSLRTKTTGINCWRGRFIWPPVSAGFLVLRKAGWKNHVASRWARKQRGECWRLLISPPFYLVWAPDRRRSALSVGVVSHPSVPFLWKSPH